jgi:hypothetical protein
MEPTEAELERAFAGLEDPALLRASADRLTLTALAQRIVEQEVMRRGLPLEPATPLDTPEAESSPETWVTAERFRDLSAAIVARAALEASEIPCFLRDENAVRLDWQISNFIGGMRLQVREQDMEAALETLRGTAIEEPAIGDTAEETDEDRCPHCGSTDISRGPHYGWFSVAMVFLLNIPMPQGRRRWTCANCGTQWDDQVSE